MADDIVVVRQPQNIVVVSSSPTTVEVEAPGPQGPPGPQGAPGARYTHTQAVASTSWSVDHLLGFKPNIAVVVNSIEVTDGVTVGHIDDNHAVVLSGIAIAGTAECS